MKIKRFFAADIRQAMRMVKDELGPDAVIMSNKSVEGGVEIVAARDFDEQVLHKQLHTAPEGKPAQPPQQPQSSSRKGFVLPALSTVKEPVHILSSARKMDVNNTALNRPLRRNPDPYMGYAEKAFLNREQTQPIKPSIAKAVELLAEVKITEPKLEVTKPLLRDVPVQPVASASEANSVVEPRSQVSDSLLSEMRKEFQQLKFSMTARLSEASFANSLQSDPVRLDLLHRLAGMGISKKLSLKLANRLSAHTSSDSAFEKAQEMLTKVFPISTEDLLEQGGVVALVGPTGVGKTTTIAKLAAKFILKHGARHVALITTDNFRIAAHEQLNSYGRILDVPVRSAANAHELRALINGFIDKKLILIDTAGMGPRDMYLVEQLMALKRNDVPVRSYLVMSATTQYKAIQSIMNAFQAVQPTACIITKMDEAESKGAVISALIEQQLPLAFMTDGQQVPEDIQVPNAQRLIAQCVAELASEHDFNAHVGYEEWVTQGYA